MKALPLGLCLLVLDIVYALEHTITVDDHDPSLRYSGGHWNMFPECTNFAVTPNASLLYNGTWHFVNGTGNAVTFDFTGTAVSVIGVIPQQNDQGPERRPNITFELDGEATNDLSEILGADSSVLYNQTVFQATGLVNGPHSLSIRTRDNSTFILDAIRYTTSSGIVNAVNGTDGSTTASSLPVESTFPYNEAGPPTSAPNGALVGGVVGAIFGTFLLVGLFVLLFLRRSQRALPRSRGGHRKRSAGARPQDGRPRAGSRAMKNLDGKTPDLSGKPGADYKDNKRSKFPEYNYSGPKPLIPLQTRATNPTRTQGGGGTGGGIRSAMGTFMSRLSSDHGSVGGGSDVVHAITTDSPRIASNVVELPADWGKRREAEKHMSMGSTIEAEGVLEGMMQSTSSHATYHEGMSPSNHYVLEHPFKTGA